MLIIKITGTVFLILGCCLFLPAQNNYQVQHFTTDNGLPSNGIKGLQWDEETGFLWIATEAGVTRYNGADFLTFSKANRPELFSERMLFLLKNREGRIYTSDEVGDIFYVMQNKLQFLGQVKLDARPSTFKLIGLMASGKLFRQSSAQPDTRLGFDFYSESLIPLNKDRMLLYRYDSLYDYRLGTPNPIFLTAADPGSNPFCIGNRLFLFNGRSGYYQLDTGTLRRTPVSLVREDTGGGEDGKPLMNRKGKEWLFWDNGMKNPILVRGSCAWLLDYQQEKLVARLICTVLPTDALLRHIKYDENSGMLFLGTDSRGIIVIRRNEVRPLRKDSAPPEHPTAYYSQIALSNGAILTSQGDVMGSTDLPKTPRLSPNSFYDPDFHRKSVPIRTSFNNFVFTTPDSVLWYSHGDTVLSYSYATHRTTSLPVEHGSITDGFALSEGGLYIANAIGIGQLRDNRIDYQYRYPKADINSNAPFAMLELSPGLIAIASCNGLIRYNIQNHQVDTLLFMPGICVRALWKYRGYLFIGTYGKGIWLYRNGMLKHIPPDKSNYLQYAHCFVPDKLGYCWISSNKGLFRARPEEMIDAFEKEGAEIDYHYYGRADGLEMTELNGGCTPCALQLNDTLLSFPSMDGLAWVDPTHPIPPRPEGGIYIDDFMADKQEVNSSSLIRPNLPSDTRDLVFSLGFPAWQNKENLDIEYKLEPWIKDWQPLKIGNNPKMYFSNLSWGNYRLLLRIRNGLDRKHYNYTEKSFRIEPRWYQQPWAWLLGLCLLTGALFVIVWLRTRQFKLRQDRLERQIAEKTRELQVKNEELEKTDHIKTRLISIISHDLVTPLKFLHLTGKSLIEKKDMLSEELQREAITEITTTSKELQLLSTNILNWIKYQNEDRRLAKESFNLHALTSQLFGIFDAMARDKRIRLINAVDEELMPYQFIEPVKIVLYNLILNGINFTQEGHILVSSTVTPEGISLVIEDTGVGMTQDQINNIMADHFIISSANVDNRKGNGLGYLIIKDLLKIIRGNLSIKSEKGRGTKVTVRIPA